MDCYLFSLDIGWEMFRLRYLFQSEINNFLLVGLGAALGALIRWIVDDSFLVNILGSVLLGLFFGLKVDLKLQLLLGVGFCGALTTFSGFLLTCLRMIHDEAFLKAFNLISITMALGIFSCFIGFSIGRQFKN